MQLGSKLIIVRNFIYEVKKKRTIILEFFPYIVLFVPVGKFKLTKVRADLIALKIDTTVGI